MPIKPIKQKQKTVNECVENAGVIYQKTVQVDGMHCRHCRSRVEEAVKDIKGVAGRVDLKKGELTVWYAEHVNDGRIKARVEKAGCEASAIMIA